MSRAIGCNINGSVKIYLVKAVGEKVSTMPTPNNPTTGPYLLSNMYLLWEELMRPIPMSSSLSQVEEMTVRVVADGVAKLE
jgi:hypothetical protein